MDNPYNSAGPLFVLVPKASTTCIALMVALGKGASNIIIKLSVNCYDCRDLLMRDNLFEVITAPRTFYIQVNIFLLHSLCRIRNYSMV